MILPNPFNYLNIYFFKQLQNKKRHCNVKSSFPVAFDTRRPYQLDTGIITEDELKAERNVTLMGHLFQCTRQN